MTVSSAISKFSYPGSGAIVPLTTPQFTANSDITAILRSSAGVETVWVETTDYVLTGAGNDQGGTLTPVVAPAVGETTVIFRDPPILQGSKYPEGGPFPSPTVEANVDLLTFIAQRLAEQISRTVVFPETDVLLNTELPSVADRGGKFFGFDLAGNPTAVAGTSANLGPVSVYIDTLLPAANALAARIVLGAQEDVITTRGDLVVGNATPSASRLALGSSGQVLTSDGTDPEWSTPTPNALPRGSVDGFQTARNGTDSDHDLDIGIGQCRDDTNTENIDLTTLITKRIDASWAVGTNQGGLDGTESVAGTPDADTWYHVFIIKRTDSDVVDALFSESATAPTLPTNYDKQRRIGSVLTDPSSNIIDYDQDGDLFRWIDPPLDTDVTNQGLTAITRTATVPTGLKISALMRVFYSTTNAGNSLYVSSLDMTDSASSTTAAPLATHVQATGGGQALDMTVITDTSAQYRTRATQVGGTVRAVTRGWMDRRGRDA